MSFFTFLNMFFFNVCPLTCIIKWGGGDWDVLFILRLYADPLLKIRSQVVGDDIETHVTHTQM